MITSPYGSWRTPITSELIVAGTTGLGGACIDGEDIYWIEMRPSDRGRNVIVRRSHNESIVDITPPGFNVRTRVHEYGGGAMLVDRGTIYFSNFADQRLYRQDRDAAPVALTDESRMRYADAVMDRARRRLICVGEDHRTDGGEPENLLLSVDAETGEIKPLARGYDFYSTPRLSPDARSLAYLAWRHPNMPWDGTELHLAAIAEDGSLTDDRIIAGGETESIFQPEWSPDGVLHFVSDRTGWWNIYRFRNGAVEALGPKQAEFGLPQWVFGMTTYGFTSPAEIICYYFDRGFARLARIDAKTGQLTDIASPYTRIDHISVAPGGVLINAASPTELASIIRLDPATNDFEIIKRSSEAEIDPGYISSPEAVEFPTSQGRTAHGFFYAPRNKDYSAPEGELPPLLVMSHGGPTAATHASLRLTIQYWTSRGIGVLDVNYGGSTGYGRAYRERLNGEWGVVDVEDCAAGAQWLVRQGRADAERLAITGGSAGGYTTLCALVFGDVFRAGASHYGVSDLEALSLDTHKFEARYSDRLVGPFPEASELYRARSPIHHLERLSAPVIFFQGLEDKIVPPDQAERMVEALKAKALPVAYVAFEGEQHGFRQAANIKCALDGELYFYARVFGFTPDVDVDPRVIEGMYNLA
ncbi:MAG: S9 family peptidase [Acidobacteria bacterium]|nr:S9 family peptidase [Acidobacteriota bacterium]MCW5969328.1 S9 family peptidase [Blastocatellales bacterium]